MPLHELKLARNRFNQNDCKRLEKHLKGESAFSHREGRRFYFDCSHEAWEQLEAALKLMTSKLDLGYHIRNKKEGGNPL